LIATSVADAAIEDSIENSSVEIALPAETGARTGPRVVSVEFNAEKEKQVSMFWPNPDSRA
jgi:hypothetical protein